MPTKAETERMLNRYFRNISQAEFNRRLIKSNPHLAPKKPKQPGKKKQGTPKVTMAMKRYAVILETGPTSISAYIPDLPGCVAVGDSVEEVSQLIQEALKMHLDGMRRDGHLIPEPTSQVMYAEVRLDATGTKTGTDSQPKTTKHTNQRIQRNRDQS